MNNAEQKEERPRNAITDLATTAGEFAASAARRAEPKVVRDCVRPPIATGD